MKKNIPFFMKKQSSGTSNDVKIIYVHYQFITKINQVILEKNSFCMKKFGHFFPLRPFF